MLLKRCNSERQASRILTKDDVLGPTKDLLYIYNACGVYGQHEHVHSFVLTFGGMLRYCALAALLQSLREAPPLLHFRKGMVQKAPMATATDWNAESQHVRNSGGNLLGTGWTILYLLADKSKR